MLTVACVWVRGHVDYSAEYVTRLHAMVTRWTAVPFRFVCLTDRPDQVACETRPIVPLPGFGWWSKLQLFNPAMGWTDRVLYLDLDTLIVAPLDPIVAWPAPFGIVADDPPSTFRPTDGRQVIKAFNSSVMVFDPGVYPDLWDAWRPSIGDRYWGDQDWIARQHPEAPTMPARWFPRLSTIGAPGRIPAEARVVLAKRPKPVQAARDWPWFNALWRAA